MTQHPTPDDGFGLIGDVRTFSLDGLEWRAFEYRSPVAPSAVTLIVQNPHLHFSAATYPGNWRSLDPDELIRRVHVGETP
ncbi:MAG TPA: hypothetical protein VH277_12010 [Gemmatimonadaceae bacterium]|jgi:hypothetical protein|nr:hypothetical protein [Gemmatimonadaceae bacterium]